MSAFCSTSKGVSTRTTAKAPSSFKCVFAHISPSSDTYGLDQRLGYILGKTLGSGTYAKVKAAWSKRHQSLV